MSNDPLAFLDAPKTQSQEDPLAFLDIPATQPTVTSKPGIFDSFGQALSYQMQSGGPAGAPSLTPEQAKEVAKEVGTQAAIGGVAGAISKAFQPLYNYARTLPYGRRAIEFLGRLTQAGTTGAAAPVVSATVKGEDLPSPKEMVKEGALWAGIDLALQAMGGGFSFLNAVNKLAKEQNLRRTQVIKRAWEGAKKYYGWGEPKVDPKTGAKIITPEQIEAMENLAKKEPEVLFGEVISVEKEPIEKGVVSFKTSKGSSYQVQPDGSTIRDKAARPEHPGEEGIQPVSEKTWYVTPEQADILGEFQSEGGPKKRLTERPDGSIGIQYLEGKDKGKFEKRTVITPEKSPKQGYLPVEIWKDGRVVHFGNPITEISGQSQDPLAFLEEGKPQETKSIKSQKSQRLQNLKNSIEDFDRKISFLEGKAKEHPENESVKKQLQSFKDRRDQEKEELQKVEGMQEEDFYAKPAAKKPELTPEQIKFRKMAEHETKKAEERAAKELQERKEQAEKERQVAFRAMGIRNPQEAAKEANETVLQPNEDAETLKQDEEELLSPHDTVRAQAFTKSLLTKDKVSKKLNGMFKSLDVEYPFKAAGAPKTGKAVKVFHDTINSYLEEAKGLINQIKELKLSKDDLWEAFLAAESGKKLATPEMNKARDLFRNYFDTSFAKYKEAGGLTLPWPDSAISRLEQEIIDLKTKLSAENIKKQAQGKINKEINQIRQTIKTLKTLKYIPKSASLITQALADTLGTIEPKYIQKYAIAAHKKRTTGALSDWIDKEPKIKEILHPYDFIGDYAGKKGKDLALLKIVKNAIEEGLASKGERLGFTMDPFKFPALAGYNVHPTLYEYITNLTNPIPFTLYDKISRYFKAAIVFDPTYLGTLIPYFRTLIQNPKYLARIPKYWKQAITDFLDKTPAYVEFVEQGGASTPYPETTDFKDWIEKEKLDNGSPAQMLKNWILSTKGAKDLMNKMAEFSWIVDRIARMAYYNMLQDKGFSSSDAAKLAAENFIDFSKLPAKSRRWLGRLFFAPTSQLLSMINDFILSISPYRLAKEFLKNKDNFKNDRINKERVGLLIGTYIVLGAISALYKAFGFKEEEFGTRYVSPEYEGDDGKTKETVLTPTHPLNYSLRWINTFSRGFGAGESSPIQKIWGRMKGQVGPLPSLIMELGENKDRNGKKIWDPVGDDAVTASAKVIKHTILKAQPYLFQKFWTPEEKAKSKDKVKEMLGIAEWFLDGIEFTYERKGEAERKRNRINYLKREMKKLQKTGELTEEAQKRYLQAIDDVIAQ